MNKKKQQKFGSAFFYLIDWLVPAAVPINSA